MQIESSCTQHNITKDYIYIEQAAEAERTTDDRTVEAVLENKMYTFRLITSRNTFNNTHGVEFLTRQDKGILISEVKAESERILSVDVILKGY